MLSWLSSSSTVQSWSTMMRLLLSILCRAIAPLSSSSTIRISLTNMTALDSFYVVSKAPLGTNTNTVHPARPRPSVGMCNTILLECASSPARHGWQAESWVKISLARQPALLFWSSQEKIRREPSSSEPSLPCRKLRYVLAYVW